tara:strand:+ start:1926 stop:2882 length:957 start_codon:yes stop_codon:yes gene_type:complete
MKKGKPGEQKKDYIERMYNNVHSKLFELQELLEDSSIEEINISDKGVTTKLINTGIKYYLVNGDYRNCALESLNFGLYEGFDGNTIERIIDYISLKNESIENNNEKLIFLDVGANNGWYTLYAKNKKNIDVISFEPSESTANCLRENLKLNNFSIDSVKQIALGDKEDEVFLYRNENISGMSSLRILDPESMQDKEKIITKRLDTLESKLKKNLGFIKVDIEGAELMFIKGAIESIKESMPIIFMELLRKWSAKFNYHPQEVLKILTSLGYQCYKIYDFGKLKIFKEITEETEETNFVFIPNSKKDIILRDLDIKIMR